MMQVSTVVISLLVEMIVVLLAVLGTWSFLSLKRNKKDRAAASKLVEQIRHQSELRFKETGSYLEEKYQFEGHELEKAIKSIDRAEKKFMQKVINMYLKREAHELEVMDASMAELIEAYKELTPAAHAVDGEIVAEVEEGGSPELTEEIESLRESNAKLSEELAITKKTMGNMIAEFGNMFGGGQESSLETEEVLEKVNAVPEKEVASASDDDELIIAETTEQQVSAVQPDDEALPSVTESVEETTKEIGEALETEPVSVENSKNQSEDNAKTEKKKGTKQESLIDFDEGIDELMDGIDLSDDDV